VSFLFRRSRRADTSPVIWLIITAAVALIVAFLVAFGGGKKITELFKGSTPTCSSDLIGHCACVFNGNTCPEVFGNPAPNTAGCPPDNDKFQCSDQNLGELIEEAKKNDGNKYAEWAFPKDAEAQKKWYGTCCRRSSADKISRTRFKVNPSATPT
jgi:hypothetical protein